jgi:hypothetical protein
MTIPTLDELEARDMDTRDNVRRSADVFSRNLAVALSVVIAFSGVCGTWAVYGYRITSLETMRTAHANEDNDRFKAVKAKETLLVTQQVLDLTIAPLQVELVNQSKGQKEIKDAMQRIEINVYEILKALGNTNNEHTQ